MASRSKRHLRPVDDVRPEQNTTHAPAIRGFSWKRVVLNTKDQIKQDNLSIVGAGVAFYAFLGVIPALAAFISIYGFFSDPIEVRNQFQDAFAALPDEARTILLDQITRFVADDSALSLGAVVSVTLALWSGSKATKALITALNIVYGARERRGFLKFNLFGLLVTVLGVICGVVVLFLIAALPPLLGTVGLGDATRTAVNTLRWPFLFSIAMTGMAAFYHFGPCRRRPRWRWFTWGSAIGTALWLAISAGFSVYAANFGSFGKTYGSLGAVVVLLMWLYLSAFAILVGAEFNSEIEKDLGRQREENLSHMRRRSVLP